MRVKVSDAERNVLDWMVAKCLALTGINQGFTVIDAIPYVQGRDGSIGGLSGAGYSRNWAQGGPIIEREKIATEYRAEFGWWAAWIHGGTDDEYGCTGPTPLIAAMRCYVASRLGDEVDVPDELMEAA